MTIPSLTSSQDEDEFVEFKSSVLGKLALVVGKNASSATDRDWFRGNRPRHPRPDHLSLVGRRARQHRQGTKARLLSLARIPGSGICCPMCSAIRASAISYAPRWAMAVWGASPPVSWRAWRAVIRQPLEFAAGGHTRPAASGGIGPSRHPGDGPQVRNPDLVPRCAPGSRPIPTVAFASNGLRMALFSDASVEYGHGPGQERH